MKQALSKEQEYIVSYNKGEGAVLVTASAGSGKTRVLTERVRYLLTEKPLYPYFSVLCLTFTNKAAREMEERLENISEIKERTFIGNFHEFCLQQILNPRKTLLGFKNIPHIFEREDDRKDVLLEVLYGNESLKEVYEFPNILDSKEKTKQQRQLLNNCLSFISEQKRNLEIVPDFVSEWKDWGAQNTYLYKDYNQRLINQNAIDYDDILLYAYRILSENPRIAKLYRQQYRYILIDEAQDLNNAQYQILKEICGTSHKNVLMVGDPKQAIYGFNGASSDYMSKDFVRDFEVKKIAIKHNYRSSKKVLELAETIQPNGGIGDNYFDGKTEIHSFENEKEEAEWIIKKIKEWKKKGSYKEEGKCLVESIGLPNICVLARSRFVFSELINQLENDDLLRGDFYLHKGLEKFEPESTFIKVFDLGLRILVNNADTLHFNQLLAQLQIFEQVSPENHLDFLFNLHQSNSETLKENHLILLSELWEKLHKNPRLLGTALEKMTQELQRLNFPEQEVPTINFDIEELKQYWSAFIRQESFEKQNIHNFRYFLALNSIKEIEEGLILATVHTTKGLEFEIVFLMGMNQGTFPHYKATTQQQLQEERNTAYVAITRAKRCLYITYPKNKKMFWGDIKPQNISKLLENIDKPL